MQTRGVRQGFTLIELMIVIAVIAILASIALVALQDARQTAKQSRTDSQISRINEMLMSRWEEYQTRQIPIQVNSGITPEDANFLRHRYMMDMMRMEMPDRVTDVIDGPATPAQIVQGRPLSVPFTALSAIPQPALHRRYQRIVNRITTQTGVAWSFEHQGSECLYMILESMETDLGSGTDFLAPSEVGDTDNDGFLEILDAWGNPIEFIRWAPGSDSPTQDHPTNATVDVAQPDPFDPFRQSFRWNTNFFPDNRDRPFALMPLVVSAGRDEIYGVYGITETLGSNTFYQGQPFRQVLLPDGTSLDPYHYYPDNTGSFVVEEPYCYDDGNALRAQLGWKVRWANGALPAGDNVSNHIGINQ